MDDCLFCKIAAGDIPSNKVYEDDDVYAFDDISPMMPVHTLIIPKEHYDSLNDDVPEEILGKVFAAARKGAKLKGIDASGFRIVSNAGEDAMQSVHHLHVHVLGGEAMNDGSPKKIG